MTPRVRVLAMLTEEQAAAVHRVLDAWLETQAIASRYEDSPDLGHITCVTEQLDAAVNAREGPS